MVCPSLFTPCRPRLPDQFALHVLRVGHWPQALHPHHMLAADLPTR